MNGQMSALHELQEMGKEIRSRTVPEANFGNIWRLIQDGHALAFGPAALKRTKLRMTVP